MRLVPAVLLGLAALPCLTQAETHMQILKGSQLVGYATVSQWLLDDGGKTVEMRMELKSANHPTRLHKLSTYDAKGHPRRMLLEIEGTSRTETIATFDATGAHVSRVVDGVAKSSDVARAGDAPWGDLSEFWFVRDRPKAGDHVRTLLFSVDKSDWVVTDVSYVGSKEIVLNGTHLRVNAIQSDSDGRATTAYVDAHGDPVRIETGDGITMEQIVTVKKAGS